jgi:hypothetical protein
VKLAGQDGEAAPCSSSSTTAPSSTSSSRQHSSAGGAPANAGNGGAAVPAVPAAVAAPLKVKRVVSGDSGEWSEEQELALVQALKQFGKELPDRSASCYLSRQPFSSSITLLLRLTLRLLSAPFFSLFTCLCEV